MSSIFNGLFDTELTNVIGVTDFLLCIVVSLVLGAALAFTYKFKTKCSESFAITLAMLPATVCVVIMTVNGNIGVGVAVAGAFSLVRFRSAQGSAKEMVCIFLAMGAGLLAGVGYLAFAALFTAIMCVVFVLYSNIAISETKKNADRRTVKITVPEDLDYTGAFEEVFEEYTSECELVSVKTYNMGSMFRLTYDVKLKDILKEKELIDQLRIRNGNLEIMFSKQESKRGEL